MFDSDQGTVYLAPWDGPPILISSILPYSNSSISFIIPYLPGTYMLPETFGCPLKICPQGHFWSSLDGLATPCPAGKYGNKVEQKIESVAQLLGPSRQELLPLGVRGKQYVFITIAASLNLHPEQFLLPG